MSIARMIEDKARLMAENERLLNTLRAIAYMDCYTREGEQPAHLLMMDLAKKALPVLGEMPHSDYDL